MDIQLEVRAKSEYLEELESKLARLNDLNMDSKAKRDDKRLAKANQFNKIKAPTADPEDDEQDIQVKYDMLESEAKELLEMKTKTI